MSFEIRRIKNYGFEVIREQCIIHRKNGTREWFNRDQTEFRSRQGKLQPAPEKDTAGLAPRRRGRSSARYSGFFPRCESIQSSRPRVREMQDPDSGTSLRSDGSNAASVLQEIERQSPEDLDRICELLETIVPKTTRVEPKKHGNKLSLEFTQQWAKSKKVKFEGFSMSDGTLRALGLLTAVYQRPRPSVLVIEEPEATIHPGALGSILDLLRHASRHSQIVVTTHSPELLDAEWIADNNLRMVSWLEGATQISDVSESTAHCPRPTLDGSR